MHACGLPSLSSPSVLTLLRACSCLLQEEVAELARKEMIASVGSASPSLAAAGSGSDSSGSGGSSAAPAKPIDVEVRWVLLGTAWSHLAVAKVPRGLRGPAIGCSLVC